MTHRLINLTLFVGLIVSLAYIGPSLDDNGPEHAIAVEELAKQRQQARFEKAAQEVCGPNASYRLTHKQGEIVCLTKRNHATGRVAQL
jgi:hypothetical protein